MNSECKAQNEIMMMITMTTIITTKFGARQSELKIKIMISGLAKSYELRFGNCFTDPEKMIKLTPVRI